MGSPQLALPGAAPQQELPPPVTTRSAASPYFSFTTSWIFGVLMTFLLADWNDILRFDSLAAAATLLVEEAEQLLQAFRVGQVAQESAFPPLDDELLVAVALAG